MKRFFIILFSSILFLPIYAEKVKKKFKLPAGTIVTIRTLETITSQETITPSCEVNSDVWDENGEIILVKKGTPVEIQVSSIRATSFGEGGQIIFQPISTYAFNGRLVGFDQQKVRFFGQDYTILKSRKKAVVNAGTSFRAYTANDLYFTIEVEE